MKNAINTLRHVVIGATLALVSTVASASTVTFNDAANSVDRGGVYSGLYSLTIDSLTLLGMCDSRFSQVNPPVTWTADILSYAGVQAGGIGKYNNPSTPATLVKYSQAGWLFSQIATLLPADYAGQADIQEAIWKIMEPTYAPVGAGAAAHYAAATGGTHDAFDWSGVMRVVTPNPLDQENVSVQEFLIGPDGGAVVPVPAAAWLLGSALAGLGWLRRRQA